MSEDNQRIKIVDVITINNKNFVEITQDDIPNIMPKKFYIAVDGTIYNATTHRLSSGTLTSRGYIYNELMDENGHRISSLQHVILMKVFGYYGIDRSNLEVNHKNGIKNDNRLENLELVTHKENMDHAYRTHLNNSYGENGVWATTTEDQVRQICEILSTDNNLTYKEIGSMVGVSENVVVQVATGYTWKRITPKFGFECKKRHSRFTDEEVHKICSIFVLHKGEKLKSHIVREIADELGYQYDSNFDSKIRKIYYKHASYFTRISDQYDYL